MIDIGSAGEVAEVRRKKKYDVHGAMKKEELASHVRKFPTDSSSASKEDKKFGAMEQHLTGCRCD